MTRPIRIQYPGAFYHVMAHANGRQWLYKTQEHLSVFIQCLEDIKNKYKVLIHAAVLMINHYHLLLETPEGNLSEIMRRFNTELSRKLNGIFRRKGAIFQKRYKAILVEKDVYFMNLIKYLAQNPVRAGIVKRCEEYAGSFINWLTDKKKGSVIYWDDIRAEFSNTKTWHSSFIDAVNGNIESNPYNNRIHAVILGNKEWVLEIRRKHPIVDNKETTGHAKYGGLELTDDKLHSFIKKQPIKYRKAVEMLIRFRYTGATIGEIRNKMNQKSYHSTAQQLYYIRKRMKESPGYAKKIENIIKSIIKNIKY